MKKATFLFILLFMTVLTKAQDYQISFTGSGQSTTVDSVFVENLTQGTTIELLGSDILHLVQTLDIANQSVARDNFHIYPNPINKTSKLSFHIDQPDDVKIEIYDVNGKLIAGQSDKVHPGTNVFEISGFPKGIYTANITTSAWQKSLRFVSVNQKAQTAAIKSGSELMNEPQTKSLKSTKSLVQMQYNDGDTLLFKVFADDYSRVITTVPTQTETINSEFVDCTDAGGNNYAVVTIGSQTWMAENLNYDTGNSWCYDGNSNNCITYGRLYDWQTALTACPTGWHLPSDAEWTVLTNHLGGESVAGGKMKSTSTLWDTPNNANNSSGFSGLASGMYSPSWSSYHDIGFMGFWWSSTEYDSANARNLLLVDYSISSESSYQDKTFGISIRCVKD